MEIAGKTAVITGAASGIGQALAIEVARRGARVAAADLNPPTDTVATIRAAGGEAEGFVCDVAEFDAVQELAQQSEARFGSVNLLAANAGIYRAGSIETCTVEHFREVIATNLLGTFYALNCFAPLIRRAAAAQGGGAILITGSEHSLGVPPNQHAVPYTTSKHALVGLADVARGDMADAGVSVTLLCPGWTLTAGVARHMAANAEVAAFIGPIVQSLETVVGIAWDCVEQGIFLVPTNLSIRDNALVRVTETVAAFDRLSHAAP